MKDKQTKQNCPICQKPTEIDHRPFCSKRCKEVDLNRWLSEGYAIPAHSPFEDDDE